MVEADMMAAFMRLLAEHTDMRNGGYGSQESKINFQHKHCGPQGLLLCNTIFCSMMEMLHKTK